MSGVDTVAGLMRDNKVDFVVHHHPLAHTAQRVAQNEHIPGRLVAEEVAQLALFLASDGSAFCTGAPFIVNGGFVAA